MENDNNRFSGFDWKQFQQYFAGTVPFPPNSRGDGSHATWVEEYVQSILKQTIPARAMPGQFDTEIVETHQAVVVKIHIPDINHAKKMTVHAAAEQIKLQGGEGKSLQLIRLPHPVMPTSCKAEYRAGVLQLHMRKRTEEEPFYEIDVKFV